MKKIDHRCEDTFEPRGKKRRCVSPSFSDRLLHDMSDSSAHNSNSTSSALPPDFTKSQIPNSMDKNCRYEESHAKKDHTSLNPIPVPIYYPTLEEFKNPLTYIASIRTSAEKYGIAKIVPPPLWNPPSEFKVNHKSKRHSKKEEFRFSTRRQRIDRLFTRQGPNAVFLRRLKVHLSREKGRLGDDASSSNQPKFPPSPQPLKIPTFNGVEIDLCNLSRIVAKVGGLTRIVSCSMWLEVVQRLKIPTTPSTVNEAAQKIQACYYKYLYTYDNLTEAQKLSLDECHVPTQDNFGYDYGRVYTVPEYKKFAADFKRCWFPNDANASGQLVENAYWKIIERADRHVSLDYGSDIDTSIKSGFPTDPRSLYSRFGWNLNVLPGLPESVLRHIKGVSGISTPWLYIGMLFATFCWHNEDSYLYSINYMHCGSPKQWFGVPGTDAPIFERAFRKICPKNQMHRLITMIKPEHLIREGCRVASTLQNPGEFIVTFPAAYHGGFSSGFNICEAVNFAPADWFPWGGKAVLDYRFRCRDPIISHECLLCKAALEPGPDISASRYIFEELTTVLRCQELYMAKLLLCGVKKEKSMSEIEAPMEELSCSLCRQFCYISALGIVDKECRYLKAFCLQCAAKDKNDKFSIFEQYSVASMVFFIRYSLPKLRRMTDDVKIRYLKHKLQQQDSKMGMNFVNEAKKEQK
eukprot:UC4_evm1s860